MILHNCDICMKPFKPSEVHPVAIQAGRKKDAQGRDLGAPEVQKAGESCGPCMAKLVEAAGSLGG